MKTLSLSTLLHIIVIWCLSVQESVQLDYENSFEQGFPGLDLDFSVSRPTTVQFYSRASAKRIRIMGRNIDANGSLWDTDGWHLLLGGLTLPGIRKTTTFTCQSPVDGKGDTFVCELPPRQPRWIPNVIARLVIRTDSLDGRITIQGEHTEYFLCINKKGHVVGRKRIKRGGGVSCVFTETINNGYTELRLVQKTEMYLGFNKDGQAMRAQRTRSGVQSVQFLKRPLPEDISTDESPMSSADIYRYYQLIRQPEMNAEADRSSEDTARNEDTAS